jgi:uncharacterized membrane protein YqjE
MDPEAPVGTQSSKKSTSESVRNWLASFLGYLELRLRLLGLESKEAGYHLLVLALLFACTDVFFVGFLVMLLAFFLYLLMLIFHWGWGWGALACGLANLIAAVVAAVILRFRIVKPLFPTTFAELKKDREWLSHKTKESE